MHTFVADHGEGVANHEIEHQIVAGREISLSTTVTAEEQSIITDGIHATAPTDTACFANALRLWKHNSRFKYVEGFAVMDDLTGEVEHAWSMLDGEKLVDPTTPFDHYHGVIIEDRDTLQRYAESEPRHGIIGNHKNRFEFLRERGYYE